MQRNELTVTYATGTLAVDTGTYPNRVSEALDALQADGWIISGNGLVTACMQLGGDDLPEVSFGLPEPTNDVWLADGFSGRHSQAFAWWAAGVESGAGIARRIGVSRQTASEQLRELRVAGLLSDDPGAWEELKATGRQRREAVRASVNEKRTRKEKFEKKSRGPVQGGRRVPATVRRRSTPSEDPTPMQRSEGTVNAYEPDTPPPKRDILREIRESEELGQFVAGHIPPGM